MKKSVLTFSIVAGIVALTILGTALGIVIYKKTAPVHPSNPQPAPTLGVWWWDNRIDSTYLDFAEEHNVTEIYYYTSSFSQKTTDFIKDANARGMKVFWLQGKYEWIEDIPSLKNRIDEYLDYQRQNEYPFDGIHLDIEPHQNPQFSDRRNELITSFVSLSAQIKESYPDLWIEYDIPFWLEDEVTYNGTTKPAYQFIIDNSSRVTVMSYRDSAEAIYDVAQDEANYAAIVNKPFNFSVETGENTDIVTFYEEGADYMYRQLDLLRDKIPDCFGIAIHHIKDWRALKN